MRVGLIITFLISIIFIGKSSGQYSTNYRFEYLQIEDGLPQNTINAIAKDSYGFMWFGTSNGICRYDGFSFESFKHDKNNPGSLPDNMINAIEPGHDMKLWIGSLSGLSYLDPVSDRIIKYSTQENGCEQIRKVTSIGSGNNDLWVSTSDNGIFYLKKNKNSKYELITHFCEQERNLAENSVNTIFISRSDKIYAGTSSGLFLFNDKENQFELFTAGNTITQTTFVNDIFENKSGDLFIASFNGLALIRKNQYTATWYLPNLSNPNSLSHGTINKVCEDIKGRIIIGSLGGLQLFNPINGDFHSFPEEGPDHFKLNNQFINTLYSDLSGNIWVGTEKGGINKFNVHQKQFDFFTNDPNNSNSLNVNTVNSIYKENGFLWIGTAGGGLNSVNLKTGKFAHYRYSGFNSGSISSDYISSILRGSDGNLWVGSWGGGLTCFHGSSENPSIQRITANTPGYRNDLVDYFVSALWNDQKGFLVIGAQGGLSVLNYKTHTFTTLISPSSSSIPQITEVGCLLKDSRDYYWAGTRNGLFRFPAGSVKEIENPVLEVENLQFFSNIPNDSLSLPGNYIISLIEDSKGNIWAGTYGNGFCKINVQKDGTLKCTTYSQKDGLSNNVTYCLQEDKLRNIWISTDYGLSKFNPDSLLFRNFYKQDGLLNNQFYWSASFRDNEGVLYFGGTEGLNYFNPKEIIEFKHLNSPKITKLKIFNTEIKSGDNRHNKIVLRKPIYTSDTILLSYRDNNLSFDFSSFDFNLPEKTNFAYMMKDIDKDWIIVPSQRRFATYNNLPAKTFDFLIKASNCDGIWNDSPTKVTIIITPPFWKTTWFRILFIIIVLLATFFTIQYQMQRIINQKRSLEEKVHQRTKQIEEQKIMLEKQADELIISNQKLERRQTQIEHQKEELEKMNNEISSQRDELIVLNNKVEEINKQQMSFFTNISHEFRTPLTLIISPIERLITKMNPSDDAVGVLKLVTRNAQRLLLLINQLLEIRKIETGNQKLKIEKTNVTDFISDIFSSFDAIAQKNEINFKNNITCDTNEVWIDKEKLEHILYNLLSNAFKFTPKQEQIHLDAFTSNINNTDFLTLSVKDTGTGIQKEHINKLFDRFYQVPENRTQGITGTGIGLSLVKDLVDALHGNIDVKSEPGHGSIFTVTIPVSKNAFSEDEIEYTELEYESDLKDKINLISENIDENEQASVNYNLEENETILVVEDNPDMRSFICSNLSEHFKVIEAENGLTGYELVKEEEPSLVISDIMMPVMNGLDLCRKIKNNLYTSHIPVILLTAKGEVDDFVEGLEQGADDYISKPFNFEILIAKVTAIIENRKKLKNRYNSAENINPDELTISKLDNQFISKVNEIVEKNYSKPEFDVMQFASEMFVSRSQLYKKLKAITGLSSNDFVNVYRLKKSVELLKPGDMQISEVAYAVGFNDPKYFSRIFRKFFKVSPSEYHKHK